MTILSAVAIALVLIGLAGMLTAKLPWRTTSGLWAWSNGLQAVDDLHDGQFGLAAISAAACAWMAWDWWNSGGGDDTRRRLRQLKDHFTGVRRTAPSAA